MTDPADPAPAGQPTTGRSPGLVLATTLAVVFGLAAAVLGWRLAADDGGEGRVDDLRAAAGRAGQTFLTYDYQHPEEHLERVLALSTGSFKRDYQSQFDQALKDIIQQTKAVSEGFVKDVYIAQLDGETGEVIIRADESLDGASGKRTVYDLYMLVTMVEVSGSWKIDQVTSLNFPTGGAGAVTTSTTAPVP